MSVRDFGLNRGFRSKKCSSSVPKKARLSRILAVLSGWETLSALNLSPLRENGETESRVELPPSRVSVDSFNSAKIGY